MTYLEFVKATICDLNQSAFEELKKILLGEYISFSIIDHENVTVDILAEKVCDYFNTLEVKTGRTFDKRIETYLKDLDTIVAPSIAKTYQTKIGDPETIVEPRSRKYYEKALSIKDVKNPSITEIIDYTRIMMCLYTEIIKNKEKPITNFDYSAFCLIPEKLINDNLNKHGLAPAPRTMKRFDTKDPYGNDRCTLILLIILLCSIVNGRVEGDSEYE